MNKINIKPIYVIFILLYLPAICFGQKKLLNQVAERKVVYNLSDNTTIEAAISNETTKVKKNRLYYWYWKSTITSNYGGYNGLLLHGNYIKYDSDKNLIEKVNFKKGCPKGDFYYWHTNGVILKIEKWKKGKIKGTVKNYDNESNLTLKQSYKNGKVHGKQLTYFGDTDKSTTIYKNGKFVKTVEAKEKKDKQTEAEDDKTKKSIFKKKKDNNNEEKSERKPLLKGKDETAEKTNKKEKLSKPEKTKKDNTPKEKLEKSKKKENT